MKQLNFKRAETAFENAEYHKSFHLYNEIANNEQLSNKERADAFNMMGAIIAFEPSLAGDTNDESGLTYFWKAIELYSHSVGALLNIVNSFGELPCYHKDISKFDFALEMLYKIKREYTEDEARIIKEKVIFRNKILGYDKQ